MRWQFKEDNALINRQAESAKIRSKYPERIPVIVEKVPNTSIPDIDKKKFLVPNDISVAQFMWIIRKRIQLPSERAIFLFVGKILPQSSASMGQIYIEHRDEDGFLYIAYSGENSFGSDECWWDRLSRVDSVLSCSVHAWEQYAVFGELTSVPLRQLMIKNYALLFFVMIFQQWFDFDDGELQ